MDLILITNRFPLDRGEEFLENEIGHLCRHFKRVFLIPTGRVSDKVHRKIPANAVVFKLPTPFRSGRKFSPAKLGKVLNQLWRIFISEVTMGGSIKPFLYPALFKLMVKEIQYALAWQNFFDELVAKEEMRKFVVYSYWMDSWLLSIIGSRKTFHNNFPIYTRVHGYDLYFERGFQSFQLFRPWIFKHVDCIFPVSKTGKDYLIDKFPGLDKLKTSYLGVSPQESVSSRSQDGIFRIVSCASMIPLKRIHLLIEALKALDQEIEWVHFGDGPLNKKLTEQAGRLPSNIKWSFAGNVTNAMLLDFYRNHPTDLFINTSETEGIPVSIMEAISFGIPVIAPKVGGIPEIVDNDYGILLESDFSANDLANQINQFLSLNVQEMNKRRKLAVQKFNQEFNAEVNYPRFCQELFPTDKVTIPA